MEFNSKSTKKIIFIVFFAALMFAVFQNIDSVLALVFKIIGFFSPVIAALCVAFVLNVLLVPIETKLFGFMEKSKNGFVNKLKRPISIITTYLAAVGIIALIIGVIIPELIDTVVGIAEKMPDFVKDAQAWIEGELHKFNINSSLPEITINWQKAANQIVDVLKNSSNMIFRGAVDATTSIIGGVFDAVFGLVLSVYVLAKKEKIGCFLKNMLTAFLKEKQTKRILHIASRTSDCFSKFIGGQLLEAFILGVLCFVGMLIFKLPNALVISAIVTITALVPIIGATIGVVAGGFIILVTDPIKAIFFVVFMLILQQLEGNLIYPKVVGKAVGLPSVIVLSAVLVGGNIGGVFGALLGVPTAATIYVLIKEYIAVKKREKSAEAPQIEENSEIS